MKHPRKAGAIAVGLARASIYGAYYPATAEWPLGGYEPNMDVFEARADQVLLAAGRKMVAALMRKRA